MSGDAHRALVRRETAVSVAINVVLSGLFFAALFGLHGPVAVAGLGGLAADCVPQAFAIGLMGSLVPGLLTRRRLARGEVAAMPGERTLAVPVRALLAAVIAAAAFGGAALLILPLVLPDTIPSAAAAAIKLVFGGAVALAVTPSAVRSALRSPASRRLA